MATEVIYDVGGGANHHANLTLFEGARQGELVVADEIRTARVFAYNDTSRPTFDGSTTNVACFMRVIPDATARHPGKWDDNKFRLDVVASYSAALTISDPHVQVIGIQVRNQGATDASAIRISVAGTVGVLVDSCIVAGTVGNIASYHAGISVYQQGCGAVIRNCIAYNCQAGVFVGYNCSGVVIEHCTLVANRECGVVTHNTPGVVELRNAYGGGNAGGDFKQGTSLACSGFTFTACASSDSQARTGVTPNVAHAMDTGARFLNIGAGTEDCHLQSGSALVGACVVVSGAEVDMVGNVRGSVGAACDIGALEYVATGGTVHNESFALGLAAGINHSAAGTFSCSVSIGWMAGTSTGSVSAICNALTSLGASLDAALAAAGTANAGAPLGVSLGTSMGAAGIVNAEVAFGALAAVLASTGGVVYSEAFSLGVAAAMSHAATAAMAAELALASSAGVGTAVQASVAVAYALGVLAGTAASGSAARTGEIALGAFAGLSVEVRATFAALVGISALVATSGEAAATANPSLTVGVIAQLLALGVKDTQSIVGAVARITAGGKGAATLAAAGRGTATLTPAPKPTATLTGQVQ